MLDDLPTLDTLNSKQLKQLIADAQQRLGAVEQAELEQTRQQMQEIMETTGFDFSRVFSEMIDGMRKGKSPKGKVRTPAKPKYCDPDTGKTWTGKGRTPAWMQSHLDDGKNKEDFLIAKGPVDQVI